MRDIPAVFIALQKSSFRSKFRLGAKEQTYVREKGEEIIRQHAHDIIRQRLAPAHPTADGKQTPWRGHPVFIAQHATATCCRGCLEKWHHIKRGQELNEDQIQYAVTIILYWLDIQIKESPQSRQPKRSEQLEMEW